MSKQRLQGTVRMWRDDKGYGFITPDAPAGTKGEDAFVHFSAIQGGRGRRSLTPGERVEYDVVQGDKGPAAGHVVRLGAA